MIKRPMWAKAVGMGFVGGVAALLVANHMGTKKMESTLPSALEPTFSLNEWPDLTPPPYWSRPLYADTSSLAALTFLNALPENLRRKILLYLMIHIWKDTM